MVSVKQEGIKYHFWVFGVTQPGIVLQSAGPFVKTQPTWSALFDKAVEYTNCTSTEG